MTETGSLEEHNKRIETLYLKHDEWLRKVGYNLTNNHDVVQDLVQELYLYLGSKRNKDLYYLDSFNLKYCYSFLRSRYFNLINREKRNVYPQKFRDIEIDDYDIEWDNELQRFENDVIDELNKLQSSSMWSSAKIYKLYQFSDDTMEELSNKIGISKSTTFMSVKKVKQHLQKTIKKPKKPLDE